MRFIFYQSYASEPHHAYLSVSTPLLSTGSSILCELPSSTMETVTRICPEVVEIVDPPRIGYQLTLKLNFAKIPRKKGKLCYNRSFCHCKSPRTSCFFDLDAAKIITEISSVHTVILSSQLRELLKNVNDQEITQGTYKPIKLVYHQWEPFYVVKQVMLGFFREQISKTSQFTLRILKFDSCVW